MKAVILLLCLSLAQIAKGHIFQHQSYPRTADNKIEPSMRTYENQLEQAQQYGILEFPKFFEWPWWWRRNEKKTKDNKESGKNHGKETSEISPQENKDKQERHKSLSDSNEGLQDIKEKNNERKYEEPIQPGNDILENHDEGKYVTPIQPGNDILENNDEGKYVTPIQPGNDILENNDEGKYVTPIQPGNDILEKNDKRNLEEPKQTENGILENNNDRKYEEPIQSGNEILKENDEGKYEEPIQTGNEILENNEKNDEKKYKASMETENENSMSGQPPFQGKSQFNPNDEGTGTDLKSEEDDSDIFTKIYSDAYMSMNSIDGDTKARFHEAFEAAAQVDNEDTRLNATQLLKKYQYGAEEHVIKTDDGYILSIFRIPPKRMLRDVQKRPVVFLMHGLLGSADDWLLMGPGKSLAYLLSDAGYDVWMGNVRGNKYSRHHVWMHPALPDFWRFSNDEISLIDLPTMIDYVLAQTNQEDLFYIGHSQGTSSFFALASSRPEYNAKISMMFALSPMAYMSNAKSPILHMLAPLSQLEPQLGDGEFNPSKETIRNQMGGAVCENEIGCRNVCSNAIFTISGIDIEGLDPTLLPVVLGHWPAGTSTKLIKQYAQWVSHGFRRYDYGPQMNEKVYGESEPPRYVLENVSAPISLYWSETDWLADPKDVELLENQLPSVKDSHEVSDPRFSNLDFLISTHAPEWVYERILTSIQLTLNLV